MQIGLESSQKSLQSVLFFFQKSNQKLLQVESFPRQRVLPPLDYNRKNIGLKTNGFNGF